MLPQPVEYLPHGENDERYRQKISDDCGDTGRPWGQSGGGPGGDGAPQLHHRNGGDGHSHDVFSKQGLPKGHGVLLV